MSNNPDLWQARYPGNFKIFCDISSEKLLTIEAINLLFANLAKEAPSLYNANSGTTIADLGCGEGDFSFNFINAFRQSMASPVRYSGIDIQPVHVQQTASRLKGVTEDCDVIEGDFVNNPIGNFKPALKLDDGADILIAANVAYYFSRGERQPEFVNSIDSLLKQNGFAVLIHNGRSDTKDIRRDHFDVPAQDVSSELREAISSTGKHSYTIKFNSSVGFPGLDSAEWDALAQNSYEHKAPPSENYRIARGLIEFLQKPLELMSDEDRGTFITALREKLGKQGNKLYSEMEIVIMPSKSCSVELDSSLGKAARSTEEMISAKAGNLASVSTSPTQRIQKSRPAF